MKKCLFVNTVLVFSLFLAASSVKAHVPFIEHLDYSMENPFTITYAVENTGAVFIEKSVAVYGYLKESSDVDVNSFTLTERDFQKPLILPDYRDQGDVSLLVTDNETGETGRVLRIETLVPVCSEYEHLLLSIAVAGPRQHSLPAYEGSTDLPFTPGSHEGVYLFETTRQGELWYERFEKKWYYQGRQFELILSKTGTYRVYFWDPEGTVGDYVVAYGAYDPWYPADRRRALWYLLPLMIDMEIHNPECRQEQRNMEPPSGEE